MNQQMGAGFTATTILKRSDFGMNAYLPNLGDEVVIEIGTEAYQEPAKGAVDESKK
jgi:polyisoprenoid-binding protein YceI